MSHFKRLCASWMGVVLASTMFMSPAAAVPLFVNETDAGDQLATAQDATIVGSYEIVINGALSNEPATLDWVDLYRISVNGSQTSAFTTGGAGLLDDPVLFLFDSLGRGVAMDDESGGFGQAFLGVLHSLAVGDYYLGIAFAGMEALDGSGASIFDTFGSGAVLTATSLASWGGFPFAIDPGVPGSYLLTASSIPEPGTLALALLGLVAIARLRPQSKA
jgi:hypothetical protein